jgi:hypothetical protein
MWLRWDNSTYPKSKRASQPDMLMVSMSGESSWRKCSTLCMPFKTIFIPISSHVLHLNIIFPSRTPTLAATWTCLTCSSFIVSKQFSTPCHAKFLAKNVMLNHFIHFKNSQVIYLYYKGTIETILGTPINTSPAEEPNYHAPKKLYPEFYHH